MMDKQVLDRLVDVADSYRRAFDEVQAHLTRLDRGDLPRWAFALDRMPIEEMASVEPELAHAELMRRRWRTALHAMAELIALEGRQGMPAVPRPEEALRSMERRELVSASWAPSESGPDRRIYSLTEAGHLAARDAAAELVALRDALTDAVASFQMLTPGSAT